MLGSTKKGLNVEEIIEALNHGKKFGLFEAGKPNGGTYYFEDGRIMKNETLWEALRIKYGLPFGHGKTLRELCPDNFIGAFNVSRNKQVWRAAHV